MNKTIFYSLMQPTKLKVAIYAFLLLLGNSMVAHSQQKFMRIKGIKVSKTNINFDASDDQLSWLKSEDGTAAPRDISKESQTFTLTDNYANINFRWKNPLKYKYLWKDSVYDDEQQVAMREFFKLVTPLFNAPSSATTEGNKSLSLAEINAAQAKNPLVVKGGFKDYDLVLLYTQLTLNQANFSEDERKALNKFTIKLKDLEDSDIEDYKGKAKKDFINLFNITDPAEVTKASADGVADIAAENLKAWNSSLDKNADKYKSVKEAFAEITLSDALFNSLFQGGIAKYLEKSQELNASNRAVLSKMGPIIEQVKKSVSGKSTAFKFGQLNDMVRIRTVDLEEGKVLQTALTVDQYKISTDGLSIEKEKSFTNKKLIFRSYDPINFSISTGLFYGSTTLQGFGTATTNGEMTVTQDTIHKNSAVTALFGNFTLGIGSRYIAPTVQLGIDPTKKRPFLLLGGGLAFPVASIALTAGGIWAFEPTLDKLKPGDKITSTTDLEKDIKHNFKVEPKGWYIGLQYNF